MPKYGNLKYVYEPKFYTGTLDLLVLTVTLGSFGAPVFKMACNLKQVSIQRKSE